MENISKLKEKLKSVLDLFEEMEAFQQLKAKWEELDPQSKLYLKFASMGGGILLCVIVTLSSIWSVHSIKNDYLEKRELLGEIQAANDEIRRLRDALPSAANQDKDVGPWPPYFESLATGAGVDKASMTVSPEKAGISGDQSKELLYDLSLKHISIKQAVRFGFNLENGARPVKLRNMEVDTNADPTGYMDARFSVSAFNLVTQK